MQDKMDQNMKTNPCKAFLGAMRKGVHGVRAFFGLPFFRFRLVQIYLLAFVTTYVIEGLSHFRSLPQFMHVVKSPLVFLVNVLIVAILFAPAILFRKRFFFYFLATFIWLIVGVADSIILHNRVTPFTANDFKMLDDALDVIIHYFKPFQIVALIALILIALFLLVFFAIKSPKTKEPVHYKSAILIVIVVIAANLSLIFGSISAGIMERTFPNLADAYQEYGLPYCFVASIIDTGIHKPSDYSKSKVDDVIASLPTATPTIYEKEDEQPNIIFIQLESFFDPKRIKGIEFPADPIPNFTHLYNQYSSGLLTVPSISAGTANTEFEILTGMNMADFGTGEYPYRTILQSSTCESLAYNLRHYGYTAHAMHNNTATFYGRDVVYSNLGFQSFDPVETMPDVTLNALNWAQDSILYREIISALDSTPGRDFVFAVSVQGHGKYPDEEILDEALELTDVNEAFDDSTIYGLKYYITQLNEMDAFIGSLVSYLSERKEKTVLVLYGDHLPGFRFEESDLNRGSLLQTEYVIWSNFDLKPIGMNLYSYQLGSYLQNRLGLHEGLITRLHQSHFDNPSKSLDETLNELRMLSYDMLYGEQYCWEQVNPYKPTELTFGYYDLPITSLHPIYDAENNQYYLTLYGLNITPYCSIYINGERHKETIYVSSKELFLPRIALHDGDKISIGVYNDGHLYRMSEPVIFQASDYK